MRLRQGFAAGIVVVLAVVAVVAFVRDGDPAPAVTAAVSSTTTTTTTTSTTSTTTTVVGVSPSSMAGDRVAEVEAILQDLWFRWFDAIYRKDADALWGVVATQELYDAGLTAMETMTFTVDPVREATVVDVREILLDRPDCLVVWHDLDITDYRGSDATADAVVVLWPSDRFGWRLMRNWKNPDDLWINDCDLVTRRDLP